jgi:serine/threonine-protein kinase
MPIYLPEEGVLGPEDIYIRGGWAIVGGDSDLDALEQSRKWIDSFIARKFPVTNKEYLEFINDLVVQGREEEAIGCIPAQADGEEFAAFYVRRDDGLYELGEDEQGEDEQGEDEQGDKWLERWPVMHVPWKSVVHYCDWYRNKTGEAWRLLSEFEWEKAARGVDGRLLPLGKPHRPQLVSYSQQSPRPRTPHHRR